ncbi:MAG: hypothetical protein H5T84_02355, partial [Thermoleophilia bacterium]|nr:hypothetical protein [Thermoleophilia bacterium]
MAASANRSEVVGESRMATAGVGAPAVELRGITKVFPGVVANDNIDLTLYRGEI